MARTRGQIKTLVEEHTGRTKDTLENSLCESALKLALMRHAFRDGSSTPSDFSITVGTYTVDISSISNLVNIVSATIVEADGTRNAPLRMKNRTWWDKRVINPEDNQQGWPSFGLRDGTNILFERPSDTGLELRLRVTTEQTFTDDTTECPISVLDLFVEYFVTAGVFENLTNFESASYWRNKALGSNWDRTSTPGGELLNAINSDKYDLAEEVKMESGRDNMISEGLSVTNAITGHSQFGNVAPWYL